jgi:hypothetical protein
MCKYFKFMRRDNPKVAALGNPAVSGNPAQGREGRTDAVTAASTVNGTNVGTDTKTDDEKLSEDREITDWTSRGVPSVEGSYDFVNFGPDSHYGLLNPCKFHCIQIAVICNR